MGLISLFKKNRQKQDAAADSGQGEFHARSEDEGRSSARARRSESARKSHDNDPAHPEKIRARRRLIGAVALVLAAVVGLPMVFDSEPKQLADDISIQIPSKDKALPASAIAEPMPPKAVAAAENPEPPPAAEKPVPPAEPAPPAKSAATPEAKSDPSVHAPAGKTAPAATPTPVTTAAAPAAPAKDADGKSPAAETQKNSKPAAARDQEGARALAILEGKTPPAKAHASSAYLVQVAALASPDKVRQLQEQLQAHQIASHTQTVATTTGNIIRVRVGPFETREEADKMRAKLAQIGLSGNLVPN